MKKFLLKVALFLFSFFVAFILAPAIEVAVRSRRVSLELPNDKAVLFIGDSHVETSVNDKFIVGAFNWARSADNYINLFARARGMLEANPQIHTVFIGVTPVILGKHADWRIFSGDTEVLLQLNIIFYGQEELIDSRNVIVSTLKDPRTSKRALKAISSGKLGTIEEFGGFNDLSDSTKLFREETKNDGEVGKEKFSYADKDFGNELTIKYLRKIVEFVHSRGGVRIIFLNPPIYHAEEFFDVQHFESILKEKFPDVEFWDYADFPIPDDGFYNVNHLNGKGAEIFSKELAKRMQQEGIINPSS